MMYSVRQPIHFTQNNSRDKTLQNLQLSMQGRDRDRVNYDDLDKNFTLFDFRQ